MGDISPDELTSSETSTRTASSDSISDGESVPSNFLYQSETNNLKDINITFHVKFPVHNVNNLNRMISSGDMSPRTEVSSDEILSITTINTNDFYFPLEKKNFIRSVDKFPMMLTEHYNVGDLEGLYHVIYTYLYESCLFKVSKPAYELEHVGLMKIYEFYKHCQSASPDGIFIARRPQKVLLKNGYLLRCKINMSGTLLHPHMIDQKICGSPPKSVMELVDEKKLSKSDVEAIRLAEYLILSQKKYIRMYLKGIASFFVNETTNKIEMYHLSMSLKSIRAMEP